MKKNWACLCLKLLTGAGLILVVLSFTFTAYAYNLSDAGDFRAVVAAVNFAIKIGGIMAALLGAVLGLLLTLGAYVWKQHLRTAATHCTDCKAWIVQTFQFHLELLLECLPRERQQAAQDKMRQMPACPDCERKG